MQGETSRMGWPTTFVRLTGCPLRCGYCDSVYAFHGGQPQSLDQILAEVARHPTPWVTVTGGEPLAQKGCLALLAALCDAGYRVSLETSGALSVAEVDQRVSIILDVKTPGSGEMEAMHWDNLPLLQPKDEAKFVLVHENDYLWAKSVLQQTGLQARCPVLFSPVHGSLDPRALADWVLRDGLMVRVQVQLHKLLWGHAPGH